MDIRELRIGNLVDTVNHGNGTTSPNKQPMWVQAIELHYVELCHLKDSIHDTRRFLKKPLNDIIPIPITEEWLLKFGFKICTGHFYNHLKNAYSRDDFDFTVCFWDDGTIDLDSAFDDMFGIELKHIKFIHQLQNLYFALTGEELKLK